MTHNILWAFYFENFLKFLNQKIVFFTSLYIEALLFEASERSIFMAKKKIQKPLSKQKWNKRFKFYHNKGSGHFLLGVAERGDYAAGHDLTTHPSLTISGRPKRKYLRLNRNPNPEDSRTSYINKHLRKDIKKSFEDTGKKKLTVKKKWKLSKKDKKRIKKIDRHKI